MLPDSVPRILINRERLPYIKGFDVRLLGYGDTIVNELSNRLGSDWVESVGGAKSNGIKLSEHMFIRTNIKCMPHTIVHFVFIEPLYLYRVVTFIEW